MNAYVVYEYIHKIVKKSKIIKSGGLFWGTKRGLGEVKWLQETSESIYRYLSFLKIWKKYSKILRHYSKLGT